MSGRYILLIAGIALVLFGCASVPEEEISVIEEVPRNVPPDVPESPLTPPAPSSSSTVPAHTEHRPAVDHPETVLSVRPPEGEAADDFTGAMVLPDSANRAVAGEDAAGVESHRELPDHILQSSAPSPPPMPVARLGDRRVPIPQVSPEVLMPRENAAERRPPSVSRLSDTDSPERATDSGAPTQSDPPTQSDAPTQSGAAGPNPPSGVVLPQESDAPSRATPDRREDTVAERTVDEGDRFHVSLSGPGWIYLGGGGAFQFLDRTTEGDEVVFSFRVPSAAADDDPETVLEFESQDLSTGSRTRHEERIMVADRDGDEGLDSAGGAEQSIATTAAGGATEGDSAAGAIVNTTADASAEDLFRRVDEFEASAEYDDAATLLEAMRRDAIGGEDAVTFRMAQLYEAEWDGRDLLLARDLYRSVIENHPLSRWRRQARERIEYLNRHFFHIR